MMESKQTPVQFTDAQRSIIQDAIEWYLEDMDYTDEQEEMLNKCLESLESSNQIVLTEINPKFLRETVFDDYNIELQETIRGLQNSQQVFEFYGDKMEAINNKLRLSNPF